MFDIVFPLCAAATWACFAVKLRDLRRDRSSLLLRVVCAQFAFVAVAFTAATPAAYVRLDHLIGVANLATLVVYVSILLCGVCFQTMLLLWTHPTVEALGGIRRQILTYGLLIAALIVLFAAGPGGATEHPIDFDARFATTPYITEFLVLYYLGFTVVWAHAGRIGWRYSGLAGRPWMVRGLRLMAAGSMLALGYSSMKLAAVAASLTGHDASRLSIVWAPMSASAGAVLIAAGLTGPAWGPHLDGIIETASRFRAYHDLHPLWSAMSRQLPALVLDQPRSRWAERWAVRDARHRLYRRVIEIEDGRLALREHSDARVAEAASELGRQIGLTDHELAATREAAVLAAALRAHREGTSKPVRPWTPEPQADLSALIDWLQRVAKAFDNSPVVHALTARDLPMTREAPDV